jgi:hypothetical protein
MVPGAESTLKNEESLDKKLPLSKIFFSVHVTSPLSYSQRQAIIVLSVILNSV